MISEQFGLQLRPVFAAQRHLLMRLQGRYDTAAASLATPTSGLLEELQLRLGQLERDSSYLEASDFEALDTPGIEAMLTAARRDFDADLGELRTDDWNGFVAACLAYDVRNSVSPLLPYETFLTAEDLAALKAQAFADLRWDRYDYMAVGVAGVLAALTDLFLVRIPRSMTYGGQEQVGSPLTSWLKQYDTSSNAEQFRNDWFAQYCRRLESEARTPYDNLATLVDGQVHNLSGRVHRFQTLGHDPILGWIFGVLDILRGSMTGFSYDKLTGTHQLFTGTTWTNLEPVGLVEALLTQLKHLLSDVATRQGLPAPLLPLAQALNVGDSGGRDRKVGELAQWMYLNGYDLRHFMVGGLAPALVELVLRAFIMGRHYRQHGTTPLLLASNPKYRLMLMSAHGVAAVANAGKVYLHAGNPLAINEAQWLALARYLLPTLKYWVFDRSRVRLERIMRATESEWTALQGRSTDLLELVCQHSFPRVALAQRRAISEIA